MIGYVNECWKLVVVTDEDDADGCILELWEEGTVRTKDCELKGFCEVETGWRNDGNCKTEGVVW
jgi:hypothetical protein